MATQAEAKSLSQFEREAEHTRADLIHTVDELHNRVSPHAIKEEMKAYVRETGQDFIRTLERRARENPLQAVAVAAGLAYPVWRLLMNIPAPVLLVGAGLALTGRGGALTASRSYRTGDRGDSVGEALKRTVQDASSTMSDTLAGLKEKTAHPLVCGAVGLLVGAAIASALPVTRAEKQLFGDTGDQLKNRAGDLMNRGLQVATEATQDVYQEAVSRAKEHGVTADVVRETIRDVGGKVRTVVEQASHALDKVETSSKSHSTSQIKPKIGE
jgi:hypothetical protein